MASSRANAPGLLRAPRTRSTSARSRASGASTSRRCIDTYSQGGLAPSSTDRKTPITAADRLNDRVVPFFDGHEVRLSTRADRPRHRVLRRSRAPRVRALPRRSRTSITTRTKATQPADQRHLRRFHKTVLNEFYRIAFARRIVSSTCCRLISMSGFTSTMRRGPIKDAGASARRRCNRSLTQCRWRRRK